MVSELLKNASGAIETAVPEDLLTGSEEDVDINLQITVLYVQLKHLHCFHF